MTRGRRKALCLSPSRVRHSAWRKIIISDSASRVITNILIVNSISCACDKRIIREFINFMLLHFK
jgi:hypothetical protein